LPKAWVRKRRCDYYYRRAKEERFRSRAAYKLLEANNKYGFIRSGDVVIDLGAAPGGWLQAARKIVDQSGFVLGVDVKSIEPFEEVNIRSIMADITESETLSAIKSFLPSSADAVISDVSPNVSGVWELDHARQIDLAQKSLQIAVSVLKHGGNFFVKVFQGDMLNNFVFEMGQTFTFVRLIKPKASRKESAELYVLGMNKR
jgi:23S rRNA (uridine2552-2'-O)-methyltransferase